jgi:hypothetical protein
MATVLLTSPVPSEGVHVMQFDVHGRDQCLVGIASPDCDIETYLGHRRGGYGFFAAEGTLKVDGDWKGGHGLCKFKRGDRVGVHVDMSRRTLQFSISRWVAEGSEAAASSPSTPSSASASISSTEAGGKRWVMTMLERTVEGLPSIVHFAVGGAAGGELSIAGGSSSLSAGEERISRYDVDVDGGYDNPNWPRELDEQLVEFLNEKASEHRKHPRNIRSSSLLDDEDARIMLAEGGTAAAAGASGQRDMPVMLFGAEDFEAGARLPDEEDAREGEAFLRSMLVAGGGAGAAVWGGEASGTSGRSISGFTPSASPALRPARGSRDISLSSPALASVSLSSSFSAADLDSWEEEGRRSGARDSDGAKGISSKSVGGARSVSAVRARFVVLKKLESLVAATLPLVNLSVSYEHDSAAGRLSAIKGRLFEATKTHLWDAAIRLTQDRKGDIPSVTLYRGTAAQHRRRSHLAQGLEGGGTGSIVRGSVVSQLYAALADMPLLRSKSKGKGMMAWQVSFVGEGGDDYGGLFRESIRELSADLQNPHASATSLFIPSPNQRYKVVALWRRPSMPHARTHTHTHMHIHTRAQVIVACPACRN